LKNAKKKSAKAGKASTKPAPAKTRAKKTPPKKESSKGIKRLTTKPTESDLEAEIHHALRIAFPWIAASDLKHQTKFSIQLGRAVIRIDGKKSYRSDGRADVLVEVKGTPLAVMELKRRGNPLTPADAKQGISYARVLEHMPPLVVVTNGKDVRLLETYSGRDWTPVGDLEAEFAKLIDAASRAAGVDIKQAIEVFLGTSADIWVSAVRQSSARLVSELSGPWGNPLLPFVPDFLIPREATREVLASLRDGARAVIVKGAPLIGKSSVLRELVLATEKSAAFAVFFVEADAHGIFQRLANLLASALAWPVSPDDVRAWLRRLSKTEGAAIVLAIDGPAPANSDIRKDMDELLSGSYGANVRIVISMDDTVVSRYTTTSSGRQATPIGRAAAEVEVLPLSDLEFKDALRILESHRIGFIHGAMAAIELRSPSMLRAIAAGVADDPSHREGNGFATFPPLLGLSLIGYARSRFNDVDLRRKLRQTAKAVLKDTEASGRSPGLALESVGVFVVRNQALEKFLNRLDIESLLTSGILKPGVDAAGESTLYVRLSEVLASELSRLIAEELPKRIKKSIPKAAAWLAETAAALPLGDIIAAQAVFEAATTGAVSLNFINALVNTPPRDEKISPGVYGINIPGRGFKTLHFREDGCLLWTENGEEYVVQPEPGKAVGSFIADMSSWLILSHLALRPFEMGTPDGNGRERVDPLLLLEIGTCPHVLRGPQNNPEQNAVLVHEVPGHGSIVCHKFGVVEPVTLAIVRLLGSKWVDAGDWINVAVGLGSFPLTMRVYTALQHVASISSAKAQWARKMLDKVVEPALRRFPSLH